VPSIYDYFQRACRRGVEPITGVPGNTCFDGEGNSARFWLETDGECILNARFQCTTCCTIVGLCEQAAELLIGMTVAEAAQCSPRKLLVLHPEIPTMRHDRAALVVDAVRSAAQQAKMEVRV
jgi:NifU-like protein involved in Fe-S cluster formation